MRIPAWMIAVGLTSLSPMGGALAADVTYTVTNGGADTKDTHATGLFHVHPARHHDGGTIAWGGSGDKVEVPDGTYDVQIIFSDGAAEKTVWLDNQTLTGTVSKTVEIGMPIADVSVIVTNGGTDTKDTQATGQFHLHRAGRHDGGDVAWGGSGAHVRVPAGQYDIEITFSDGAASKTIWLDNQTFKDRYEHTVEVGLPVVEASYVITNNGEDTKDTQATGQFHIHPAGRHDAGDVAWGGSGGHVRLPAGHYDVEITFSDGAATRTLWLNNQDFTSNVSGTVEAGVPTADVSFTITNNGVDTKDTQATGQFHLHPAGRHDAGDVAWGGSGGHVRVPAGDYDVEITFSDGASQRTVWLDRQHFSGSVVRTVEAGVPTAEVTYTITNGGVDTKDSDATAQFHLHPAGRHDGGDVAWSGTGGHVRVPTGDYDVEITFSQGLVHKTIWIDRQAFSGDVARTVDAGVTFTKPTVTVTQDGKDLGAEATVTYYTPGARYDFGSVHGGAEALLEQGRYDILASHEDAEGWLRDQTLSGSPHLTIAITKPVVQTLAAGAPPPKACTIEVYGINFDFDKSDLRPDSEPVLRQVLALFTGDTSFAAEVGGHTDNVGKPDYNLRLSDARAAAVKTWLTKNGVEAKRVTSHGYGDTKPLAPNTTDENRFRNRRVELRRTNCK
jgi:outer membrane protein OmpA-like peptidoglycan-associated protein